MPSKKIKFDMRAVRRSSIKGTHSECACRSIMVTKNKQGTVTNRWFSTKDCQGKMYIFTIGGNKATMKVLCEKHFRECTEISDQLFKEQHRSNWHKIVYGGNKELKRRLEDKQVKENPSKSFIERVMELTEPEMADKRVQERIDEFNKRLKEINPNSTGLQYI